MTLKEQTKQGVSINTRMLDLIFILVFTVVMKGCYVELYSEQWVSFCLQNCKYQWIVYFVILGNITFDFENFMSRKDEITAKLLPNF